MEQNQQPKWEASFIKRLTKAKAERIWPFFTDFFSLNKWFPGIPTCYGIRGTNGDLGCVRYCAGFSIPSDPSEQHNTDSYLPVVLWTKEQLIAIDHVERCLSYEIIESNIGYKSYVAKVKVVPAEDGEEAGTGCVIEWTFKVDPVEGCEFDDIVSTWDMAIETVAKRMEDEAVQGSKQPYKELQVIICIYYSYSTYASMSPLRVAQVIKSIDIQMWRAEFESPVPPYSTF